MKSRHIKVVSSLLLTLALAVGCSDDPTAPTMDDNGPGPAPQPTTAIYVDQTNGDDTNTGAASSPLKTITAALAIADSADTVQVAPGNYGVDETFPLIVPASVVLLGHEPSKGDGIPSTSIVGMGAFVNSQPNATTLQHATVVCSDDAQVRGFRIAANSFEFGHFAVAMDGARPGGGGSRATIQNNTIEGVWGAISTHLADDVHVIDNVITTDRYGAWTPATDEFLFRGNEVTSSYYGVNLPVGDQNTAWVVNNVFHIPSGRWGLTTQQGLTHASGNQFFPLPGAVNTTGLFALQGNSIARNNSFQGVHTGILAWNGGGSDAGTPTEDGNNNFSQVTGPAIDLVGSGTISAHGNTWRNAQPILGEDIVISGSGTVDAPYVIRYYIDPVNGSDTNTGLSGSPFRSITHAVSVAGTEPVVLQLANGTYSADETFPITFPAYATLVGDVGTQYGANCIIRGSGTLPSDWDGATIHAQDGIEMEGVTVELDVTTILYFSVYISGGRGDFLNCKFAGGYGGVGTGASGSIGNLVDSMADCNSYGVYTGSANISNSTFSASLPAVVRAGTVTNSTFNVTGYSGACQFNGPTTVTGCTFNYQPSSNPIEMSYGAIVADYGTPQVRNCTFNTDYAVTIRNSSQIDFGTMASPGGNNFSGTGVAAIRHQGANTIMAIGNTWVNNPPVVGSDILLESTGTVTTQ